MTTDPTIAAASPRPLQVEWLEMTGPLPVIFFRQKPSRIRIVGVGGTGARLAPRGIRGANLRGTVRRWRGGNSTRSISGFTLLELLAVVAIIGLMASLTLPHLKGFTRTNAMSAATRQLLDDVAYARQRAIANRSTVFMVFAPPGPWNYVNLTTNAALPHQTFTNLVNDQYRGYALLSLRSVGDQPGRWHPSYLTDWKTLPSGVLIPTNMYVTNLTALQVTNYVYTSNSLATPVSRILSPVTPFFYNTQRALPFPTLQTWAYNLPYIAFSPDGSLVDENGNRMNDQY